MHGTQLHVTPLHATHAYDHLVPVVSNEESDKIIWFVLDIATTSIMYYTMSDC
jgi:hypothetical protein